MKPFGTELVIGLLAVGLNYGATFKLPTTSLLKDPVQTLSTTVPVLFVGHIFLVILAHVLRGTTNKAFVSGIFTLTTISFILIGFIIIEISRL